ncbi:MAG: MASE1 domain-containing protein [Candidatus Methanomethylophilaceae archaeon]|nr:MASE1 domain-containing protein [Candidatus Methanomethylophilaceae archaeon]
MKGTPVQGSNGSFRWATHGFTSLIGDITVLTLSIVVLSFISTLFTYSSHGPPLMYMPLGLAFAFILVRGDDRWPGLFLGMIANSLMFDDGLLSTLPGIIVSNIGITLSVLIGVRLVKRYGSPKNPFSSLRTLPPLLLAMVVVVPVLSTVSLLFMSYMETGHLDDLSYVISSHFFGHCLGAALFLPLFISLDLYVKKLDSNLDPFVAVPLFLVITLGSIVMFNQFSGSNAELALILAVLIVPLVLLTVNYAGLFGGTMGIFLISVGMINSYSDMANSSLNMEFWSTILLQAFLIMLTVVVCIYYSVVRESKDNLKELNHRVRNSLLMVIGLVRLQAMSAQSPSGIVLDDLENRLIVMSTVCDAQHEYGYGTANFAGIMSVLSPRMVDWPRLTGSGWDMQLEIERANLAALIVNEVATGAGRFGDRRSIQIDLERKGADVVMSIDLNRDGPIRSLSDPELMLLRKIIMRHPRTLIQTIGSGLIITMPESAGAEGDYMTGGSA